MPSSKYTDEELRHEMHHSAAFLKRDLSIGLPGILPTEKIARLVALAKLRYGNDFVNKAISEAQAKVDSVEQGACPLCNGFILTETSVLCEMHQQIVNAPQVDITDKIQ